MGGVGEYRTDDMIMNDEVGWDSLFYFLNQTELNIEQTTNVNIKVRLH